MRLASVGMAAWSCTSPAHATPAACDTTHGAGPYFTPAACPAAVDGWLVPTEQWRGLMAERSLMFDQLRRDAVALRGAARELAAVPEPPSRITWLLAGVAAGALLVFTVESAR